MSNTDYLDNMTWDNMVEVIRASILCGTFYCRDATDSECSSILRTAVIWC